MSTSLEATASMWYDLHHDYNSWVRPLQECVYTSPTFQDWVRRRHHELDQTPLQQCCECSATFCNQNTTQRTCIIDYIHHNNTHLVSSLYSKICRRDDATAPGSSIPTTIIGGWILIGGYYVIVVYMMLLIQTSNQSYIVANVKYLDSTPHWNKDYTHRSGLYKYAKVV